MDILEHLKTQLNGPLMERLGNAVGLDTTQARSVGQAILPAQVAVIQQKASSDAGAQHLLALVAQLPGEGVQEPLETPAGLEQVRQSGTALLPQLLGNRLDDTVQQLAAQTGAGRGGVLGMMQMILPLVLGLIGQQAGELGLNAGSLHRLFPGDQGAAGIGGVAADLGAAVGLGGAAVAGLKNATDRPGEGISGLGAGLGKGIGNAAGGLGAAAAAGLGGAAGKLGEGVPGLGADLSKGIGATGLVTDGMATVGQGAGLGGGVLHTNPALGGRRGLGLLWLLPLLLLLLLGGCFLLRGKSSTPFTVVSPQSGTSVSANAPLMVRGTGQAGETVTLSEGGAAVANGKVADDGSYSLSVPNVTLGDHSYSLAQSGNEKALDLKLSAAHSFSFTTPTSVTAVEGTGKPGDVLEVFENGGSLGKVTVGADGKWSLKLPNVAAGDHTFTVKGPGGAELGTLRTTLALPGGTAGGEGAFALSSPAANAALPAGAFEMKGTGRAGEVLEIFEDGVSLGKVTVGADGTWSLNVPSPAAGAHTYTVKGQGGAELGSVRATVAAASAGTAACTKTFSLSIPDGQTVAQPFRFGGVGSGKSYTVTVLRGERKIGSKVLPLDNTCGYSYTSEPGKGTITYSVAPTGSAEAAGKITLTVK